MMNGHKRVTRTFFAPVYLEVLSKIPGKTIPDSLFEDLKGKGSAIRHFLLGNLDGKREEVQYGIK